MSGYAHNKIKLAEVITRLDWGGSPDIVRIICSYLDHNLYDITLITGKTHYPSLKTRDFLKKIGQRTIWVSQLKRNINPLNDLSALIKLYLIFRSENFDIVHTHTAKAGVLARIAAHLAGNSIIIHTPHGNNFYGYFSPFFSKIIVMLEKLLASITDRIVVLTELEKNDLLKHKVTNSKKNQPDLPRPGIR